MKLLVTDNRKIQQIRKQFTENFPFLKLEFFSRAHAFSRSSLRKLLTQEDQTIAECRTKHYKGTMQIDPDMTVVQLETQFRDRYGLDVQVFRKSGKVWLETTVTDGWTLAQQNSQGESLSKLVFTKRPKPD